MADWKRHAQNIETGELIYTTSYKENKDLSTRFYKCRGRVYREFREAVLESAELGNAKLDFILIRSLWLYPERGAIVYSPKGVRIQDFKSENDALEKVERSLKFRKRPSEDVIALRTEAYNKERAAWLESRKSRMIAQQKEKILAERLREKQYEEVADIHGSW